MNFYDIDELTKYLDEVFIPSNIKRKLSNNISSDTLDIYYINYSDIYELYLDDNLLDYAIKYISNLGIYIDNSLDENLSLCSREYYIVEKNSKYLFNILFCTKDKKEYYKIRDEIFNIYLGYIDNMLNKFILLYDVPKEDLKSDLSLALLEAIEKYDLTMFFSSFLNNYVKRYLSKKYSTYGARISDIETTSYYSECIFNGYYLDKTNSYEAFSKINNRVPDDIYDIELLDDDFESFFSKIEYDLLIQYIIELKRDKYYHEEVFDRDKRYFMMYYGIRFDRPYNTIEIGKIVGRSNTVIATRIRYFTAKLVERIKRESYINGKSYRLLKREYEKYKKQG